MKRFLARYLLPALILPFALLGCVEQQTYSGKVVPLGVGHQNSQFQDVRLGVVRSENFGKSYTFLQDWEKKAGSGLVYSGPTAAGFTSTITAALASRFKSVVDLATPAEARAKHVDMVMTLDTKVILGNMSFETSSITVTGIFTTPDGSAIDTVTGHGEATVSWPNFGPKYDVVLGQAMNGFTSALDGSKKLAMAAEPITRRATALAETRQLPVSPAPVPAVASSRFPTAPVAVSYRTGPVHPDDVAVIIGNADYGKLGKDIPDVKPAYADADSMKLYAMHTLGIRPGNIIFMRDATGAQMTRVFGSAADPHGQLADWVKPGDSVFVYYAGHGAPAIRNGSPYLVPADADSSRIDLNGYPLKQLYDNLSRLPAAHVTVVLEACFSGLSQAGSVVAKASPVYIRVKAPKPPRSLTVIAAGAPDQVASWDENGDHGLFTEYFLKAEAGAADKPPYGNGDGKVSYAELGRYLKSTLTYYARRYYGRDQVAQITIGFRP